MQPARSAYTSRRAVPPAWGMGLTYRRHNDSSVGSKGGRERLIGETGPAETRGIMASGSISHDCEFKKAALTMCGQRWSLRRKRCVAKSERKEESGNVASFELAQRFLNGPSIEPELVLT
jgi:hypothetical protein